MTAPAVLVVDDNETNLKLLSFLLNRMGCEVREAHDAETARDILLGWTPDLILLDLQLPGMSGMDFARLLRSGESGPSRVIIVAVTASAMKEDEAAAIDAGCDVFLSKPIDTRQLPKRLEELLRNRSKSEGVGHGSSAAG